MTSINPSLLCNFFRTHWAMSMASPNSGSKGRRPVTSSNNTTPKLYMSLFSSTFNVYTYSANHEKNIQFSVMLLFGLKKHNVILGLRVKIPCYVRVYVIYNIYVKKTLTIKTYIMCFSTKLDHTSIHSYIMTSLVEDLQKLARRFAWSNVAVRSRY